MQVDLFLQAVAILVGMGVLTGLLMASIRLSNNMPRAASWTARLHDGLATIGATLLIYIVAGSCALLLLNALKLPYVS